jgi:hypothetical protein
MNMVDDKLSKNRQLNSIVPQQVATIPPPKNGQPLHNFTTEMPSSLSSGWPVSPITGGMLPNGRGFSRECDSPTMVC